MKRTILHVDMDAFYASVEQRDRKELRNKAIAVGGRSQRGVVTTASYEARRYGVRSAMSVEKAKKLCPDLIVVPGNREKYKAVSRQVFSILRNYSDKLEKLSIDEGFLDLGSRDYRGPVKDIREDIYRNTGLTLSIGVSYNKFLAKLASDLDKPNGLTVIREEEAVEFLRPFPVSKIFGVGPRMEEELRTLGIYYIGDLQNYDKEILLDKFGKKGIDIYNYSFGLDHRELELDEEIQSISEEETFEEDLFERQLLYGKLYDQALSLEKELSKKKLLFKTITVKLKYSDFSIETRSLSLSLPDHNSHRIYELSKYILDRRFTVSKPVRLVGISLSNLIFPEEPRQMTIDIGHD